MYNPTIFNSQPNTKIKFFDDRSKRHTQEDPEEKEEEEEGSDKNIIKGIQLFYFNRVILRPVPC
jgi:hypothetical protein